MEKELVILFLVLSLFMIGVVSFIHFVNVTDCNDISESTSYESKHITLGGCYVKIDGKWVPQENWLVSEETK